MPTIPEKLTQIETLTIMLRAAGISLARRSPEQQKTARVLEMIADSIDEHADEILLIYTRNENPISKEPQ